MLVLNRRKKIDNKLDISDKNVETCTTTRDASLADLKNLAFISIDNRLHLGFLMRELYENFVSQCISKKNVNYTCVVMLKFIKRCIVINDKMLYVYLFS